MKNKVLLMMLAVMSAGICASEERQASASSEQSLELNAARTQSVRRKKIRDFKMNGLAIQETREWCGPLWAVRIWDALISEYPEDSKDSKCVSYSVGLMCFPCQVVAGCLMVQKITHVAMVEAEPKSSKEGSLNQLTLEEGDAARQPGEERESVL